MIDSPLLDRPAATASDVAATEDLLAHLLGTAQDVVLLQGEAILGLEAAARGLARPGTHALNIVTGPYGEVFGGWLRAGGAQVHDLTSGFDTAIDVGAVTAALARGPWDVVSIVHAEAATGGRNPMAAVAEAVSASGALLVVDAVASVGAEPVTPDAWDADVVVLGPQKALAGPAGLSAVVVSERAWRVMGANPHAPRRSYLSLLDLKEAWLDRGRAALPGYVASLELAALRQALDRVAAEGIDAVIARHRRSAETARAGLRELGLPPWIAADEHAAAVVTTFAAPDGLSAAALAARLHDAGGIMTTPAPGPLAERVLRINHTGRAADPATVTDELARIGRALRDRP